MKNKSSALIDHFDKLIVATTVTLMSGLVNLHQLDILHFSTYYSAGSFDSRPC